MKDIIRYMALIPEAMMAGSRHKSSRSIGEWTSALQPVQPGSTAPGKRAAPARKRGTPPQSSGPASQVAERERQITDAEKQIAEMERQLAARRKNSTNSSKPPSSGGMAGAPRPPGRTRKNKRKPGGQPGHPGYHRSLVPVTEVGAIDVQLPEQ